MAKRKTTTKRPTGKIAAKKKTPSSTAKSKSSGFDLKKVVGAGAILAIGAYAFSRKDGENTAVATVNDAGNKLMASTDALLPTESAAQIEAKYPNARMILTAFANYSKSKFGEQLADNVQRMQSYLNYTKNVLRAKQNKARADYAISVSYDPYLAIAHAKAFGLT